LTALPNVSIFLRLREAQGIGLWRLVILLPPAWVVDIPSKALEAVIPHELAHVRRWDLWVSLGQRLVETLLFYHPAVW
jgi:D-alanyl-D-alanine endopeptidase (penicillin-binding protein 7)